VPAKFEAVDERKFARYVEADGGLCLKLQVVSRKGWPDRMVLLRGGNLFFIEFKRVESGGAQSKVKALQKIVHAALRCLGQDIQVCYTFNEARTYYDKFKKKNKIT